MFPVVFFSVFFSISLVGASVFGVSLNKICLIPLFAHIFFTTASTGKIKITINKNNIWLYFFYFISILSALFAMTRSYSIRFEGYNSFLINLLIQVLLIYLPILILLDNSKLKIQYKEAFEKAIIITARIHAFYGIVQFIEYYYFDFDINKFLLSDLLGGLGYSYDWSTYVWSDNLGQKLKIISLNHEGAFFGLCLLSGLLLDKKLIMKAVYILVALLSLQRTTLIGIFFIFIINLFEYFCSRKDSKKTIKIVFSGVLLLILFIYLYNNIPLIQEQIRRLIERFEFIGNNNTSIDRGTMRHILYIPYSIVALIKSGIISFFIGVGPRIGGIGFATAGDIASIVGLNRHMLTNAWSVECDFADLLLGMGILGFISYYIFLFKKMRSRNIAVRHFVYLYFIIGFMYNFCWVTFSQLLFIFFATVYPYVNDTYTTIDNTL